MDTFVRSKVYLEQVKQDMFDMCTPPVPCISLGQMQQKLAVTEAAVKPQKKKDKKMSRYYDEDLDAYVETTAPKTDDARARDRLTARVRDLDYPVTQKLAKEFGLSDDEPPETFADAIARIKKGHYVLPSHIKEDQKLHGPLHYIKWRDPSVKEDADGYRDARQKFSKATEDTIDEIMVKSPEDGLKALRKLEQFKA